MTTMLPCPVCVQGSCNACWGFGFKEEQHHPPIGLVRTPCEVCNGLGTCQTCNGDCEITEEHYNAIVQHHDEPLPPGYANDTEKWKDIL